MLIEIIEQGGIYAYVLNNEYLYIGKTKHSFTIRDNEHKSAAEPTVFEKYLRQNSNIQLIILYDCAACH